MMTNDGYMKTGRRWRSRVVIFRCEDDTYDRILALIQQSANCQVVFTKSSDLKIIIKEVGF
jgi:hypothetical protein